MQNSGLASAYSFKHVRYSIDYMYFAIQHSKRDYLLFTENDYNRCYRGSVTICPSNVPIFSAQTKTCEMSLYFQTAAIYHLCRRQLIYNHQAPFFQKFGTVWVYYFSTPHSVTLQCRNVSGQTSYNELLFGAGLLHNTANCYISSDEIQVFPELHGETSKTGAVETLLTSKDASSHQCGNPETRGDNADRNPRTRRDPFENLRTSANLRCRFSPTSSPNLFTPRQTTTLASNYNCIHVCRHHFRNNYLLLSFLPTPQMLHDLQTKHCARS